MAHSAEQGRSGFEARIARDHETIRQLATDGVLLRVAHIKAQADPAIQAQLEAAGSTPEAVFDAVLARPEKGEPLSPRWQEVERLERVAKEEIERSAPEILEAATSVGMRRPEGTRENYTAIDPEEAIFAVEGGANKTSVVRRGVAIRAMHVLYGPTLSGRRLSQFGSDRKIAPTRADGSDNLEYKIICDLAGDHLPIGEEFTEFGANMATALADGYKIADDAIQAGDVKYLYHPDSTMPNLDMVRASGPGLPGGFKTLLEELGENGLRNKQLVIATNGQYRPKDVLQAVKWAEEIGIPMLEPVAIGDEAGDSCDFKGGVVVTPPRAAAAYVNELAIYGRMTGEYLNPGV